MTLSAIQRRVTRIETAAGPGHSNYHHLTDTELDREIIARLQAQLTLAGRGDPDAAYAAFRDSSASLHPETFLEFLKRSQMPAFLEMAEYLWE
jgi:hypothetical protein